MDVDIDKWFRCEIDKKEFKELCKKSDWQGFKHMLIYFSSLIFFGYLFESIIFVNNNSIFLEDKKGIAVSGGGDAKIEFYSNPSKISKEIVWEENKFDVEIIGDAKIEKFNFKFDDHQWIWLIISLLKWGDFLKKKNVFSAKNFLNIVFV